MEIAIIGGGPAGLRAAEVVASGGGAVTLFDARASVGRKFLVAGVGGLNLTKDEPMEEFVSNYRAPNQNESFWSSLIAEFGPEALREWARSLGVETFAASTRRVYPREMKAAPLLRRWVQRLRELGVRFAMHHRFTGLRANARWEVDFETQDSVRTVSTDAVIFALGGGSWPDTGSDGNWVSVFEKCGVEVAPLQPANCGWEVAWPAQLLGVAEGLPLKNIVAHAGRSAAKGELLLTKYGLEGGAIYKLTPELRAMSQPMLMVDFKPDSNVERLMAKMGPVRRNILAEARQRWRLSDGAYALLTHSGKTYDTPQSLAGDVKYFEIALGEPRPLAEAISSAGGVRWTELDGNLMLRKMPGIFLAGEMVDWEAPTGGYLMQGCFAMGTRAGKSALNWIKNQG